MPDQELCKNCREPLCPRLPLGWGDDGKRLRQGLDNCPTNHPQDVHHGDFYGTLANDLCTRHKVVEIDAKEASMCLLNDMDSRFDRFCRHPAAPKEPRFATAVDLCCSDLRPKWCPLTDDDGQPNAGILLKAEIPAKEDGKPYGPYPSPGLDEVVNKTTKEKENGT